MWGLQPQIILKESHCGILAMQSGSLSQELNPFQAQRGANLMDSFIGYLESSVCRLLLWSQLGTMSDCLLQFQTSRFEILRCGNTGAEHINGRRTGMLKTLQWAPGYLFVCVIYMYIVGSILDPSSEVVHSELRYRIIHGIDTIENRPCYHNQTHKHTNTQTMSSHQQKSCLV